jgi:hypothetical protein
MAPQFVSPSSPGCCYLHCRFVNSYNSLFYIGNGLLNEPQSHFASLLTRCRVVVLFSAFFKRYDTSITVNGQTGCPSSDPDCLAELRIQLGA